MLERLSDAEIRQACRLRLEAVEQWLRRLAHDKLSAISSDYLNAKDAAGHRLIKKAIAEQALGRRNSDIARYPRAVDAFLIDDLMDVICNPSLYHHFRDALSDAFPQGRDEAHTFLTRLIAPRNRLAHANGISLRQAEQVVCYAGDVIESLKSYYSRLGQQMQYNVPTIMRVTDSLGNSFERSQLGEVHDGGIGMFLHKTCALQPGDILTIEVEIDPSFDPATYKIAWASIKPLGAIEKSAPKIVVPIKDVHVGLEWSIHCTVVTNRSWHRMSSGWDDFLYVTYKVLPPA